MNTSEPQPPQETPAIGRNEPCPCGSKKKFKRCCGIDAAPKLSLPKLNWNAPAAGQAPALGAVGGGAGGFDPSQMDPQMIAQFSQMMQRLPKGQMQKLQSIMQRAMAGKDVTREAEDFEKSLPVDFQKQILAMKLPGMEAAAAGGGAATAADLTPEAARKIVEEARAEGKISAEQAAQLLGDGTGAPAAETGGEDSPSGLGRLWKNLRGKKAPS